VRHHILFFSFFSSIRAIENNGKFETASYSSVRNSQQGVWIEQIHKGIVIVQPVSRGRRGVVLMLDL
jgi:hypothetical protein